LSAEHNEGWDTSQTTAKMSTVNVS